MPARLEETVLGRRLLTLVAIFIGLAALASLAAPRDGGVDRPSSVAPFQTATPAPAAEAPELEPQPGQEPAPVDDVPGEPPLNRLDAQGTDQAVEVEAGRRVRLAIESTELVTVQIGQDGPIEAIDPDAPARFDLSYEQEITLPILNLTAGETIGELRVLPAEPTQAAQAG